MQDSTAEIEKRDYLPNKPLVEALLEIKWGRADEPDPAYPLIVGALYERLQGDYPHIEDLPLAEAPPHIAVQAVRHRFRAKPEGWPLVQIGPGIATLNDTEDYAKDDFLNRAKLLPSQVIESVPSSYAKPLITSLLLQYIDAVEFDYGNLDVRDFLKSRLHVELSVPDTLFQGQPVRDQPVHLGMQMAFPLSEPAGQVELRVATGQRGGKPAVIWHTTVMTTGPAAELAAQKFDEWLEAAHGVTHHWFFALVQGELLKGFLRK